MLQWRVILLAALAVLLLLAGLAILILPDPYEGPLVKQIDEEEGLVFVEYDGRRCPVAAPHVCPLSSPGPTF